MGRRKTDRTSKIWIAASDSLDFYRMRASMRRTRLEGTHIGRQPLALDHEAIQRDRGRGESIRQIEKAYRISTATVQRVLRRHASNS